jgi:uncharacterized protein YjiS (DUF1127 family)
MLILHSCIAAKPVPEPGGHVYIALHQRGVPPRPARVKIMTEAIKFISTKLGAWRRYRASLRELYCLTDRELSDLGIARWEIDDVARRSAGL